MKDDRGNDRYVCHPIPHPPTLGLDGDRNTRLKSGDNTRKSGAMQCYGQLGIKEV